MISAISKYMPRWLMAIIATALVLATVVGSGQDSAEAIDPADTDTVYIADGTNFADALMGATIAALNTSPMLGVAGTNTGDTIPGDTVEELDRLTNNKTDLLDTIFVFGGSNAVSDSVVSQLGAWANDVQRIAGDSRWGTYEAISQMLPSMIDEAAHAQEADNADTLDGLDSGAFALSDQTCSAGEVVTGIAADGTPTCAADQVDGGNAETLDGLDSTDFVRPIYALIDSTGAVVRGSDVSSATRSSTGTYRVIFNTDVSTCAWVANPSNPSDAPETIQAATQGTLSASDEVFVQTADNSGTLTDSGFMLIVMC